MSQYNRPRAVALAQQAWDALRQGRWAAAREAAQQAVEADPTLIDGYRTLGYAQVALEDLAGARQTYERAFALTREDPWLWLARGILETHEGHLDRAVASYREAIRLHSPEPRIHAEALWRLADLLHDVDEEQRLLEEAYALEPGNAQVLSGLGEVYRRRGEYERAVPLLRQARAHNPTLAIPAYGLALSLAALGQWQAAQAEAQEAVRLRPGHAQFEKAARAIEHAIAQGAAEGQPAWRG